jgi:hypothetical protein
LACAARSLLFRPRLVETPFGRSPGAREWIPSRRRPERSTLPVVICWRGGPKRGFRRTFFYLAGIARGNIPNAAAVFWFSRAIKEQSSCRPQSHHSKPPLLHITSGEGEGVFRSREACEDMGAVGAYAPRSPCPQHEEKKSPERARDSARSEEPSFPAPLDRNTLWAEPRSEGVDRIEMKPRAERPARCCMQLPLVGVCEGPLWSRWTPGY